MTPEHAQALAFVRQRHTNAEGKRRPWDSKDHYSSQGREVSICLDALDQALAEVDALAARVRESREEARAETCTAVLVAINAEAERHFKNSACWNVLVKLHAEVCALQQPAPGEEPKP